MLECLRRLLLASVIGMIPADGVVAPTLGILLCFVFLYVFIDFRPYRNPDDSDLGVILQYSVTLFFLAGLLAKVNVTTDLTPSEAVIFRYVLMGILLLGPFMILADNFKSLFLRRKVKVSLKDQLQKQEEVEAEYRKAQATDTLKNEVERIQADAIKTNVVNTFQTGLDKGAGVAPKNKTAPTAKLSTRGEPLGSTIERSISSRTISTTAKDGSQASIAQESLQERALLVAILDRLEVMGYTKTASMLKSKIKKSLSHSLAEDNIDIEHVVKEFEKSWRVAFHAPSKMTLKSPSKSPMKSTPRSASKLALKGKQLGTTI